MEQKCIRHEFFFFPLAYGMRHAISTKYLLPLSIGVDLKEGENLLEKIKDSYQSMLQKFDGKAIAYC